MRLDHPVCATCGVQYDPDHPAYLRGECPICRDERQYVGAGGQAWTSLRELTGSGRRGEVREEVPGLWGVGTEEPFAIGQRALVVPGEGGALLWDSTTYLDDETVARVREVAGPDGVAGIALSHPHFYSAMCEWSEALGGVPIWVHADDRRWLARRDHVELWDGDRLEALPGRLLLRAGIHFAGGTLLHWPGLDGAGALCSSDIVTVAADRRFVSFMRSYPNYIPEHPDRIAAALALIDDLPYTALYGGWWGRVVSGDARSAVIASAHRYFDAIGAPTTALPALQAPPALPAPPA